ncbi:PQQ-dependent sugar dehydrogenase [Xylanimonas sp. McL0601]|uniref:PQQ-dependent sugar dehydrogenase n=1 Tax=Xylanimonas sp. McL0601 TaxID=3414739 RepID=UPI003CED9D40
MNGGRRGPTAVAALVALVLVAACDAGQPVEPTAPASAQSGPTTTTTPMPSPSVVGPVTATATTVVSDLRAPWGLAPLPDGRFLVTLRDDARLVVVDPDAKSVTTVSGAGSVQLQEQTRPAGEGGLLGVAVQPRAGAATDSSDTGPFTVFLYRTGADDNAVVRARLTLDPRGETTPRGPVLGELTTVLDGIHKAGNHDGGRLAFGPDGDLYVTTGDAGDGPSAQDKGSLNGKILRITPDGDPAPGNPFRGSPVWSLGHRNVQGLGWDAQGRMFASEFGQNTWDELNQIVPGGNYGWPTVEGAASGTPSEGPDGGPAVVDGFVQPLVTWPTDDASPSGLAVTADAVYLASLHGARLWRVPLATAPGASAVPVAGTAAIGEPQALVTDQGRLRAVVADPDGSLWVLTNNTDGRGSPRAGDDRLLHVVITPG